MEAFQLTSADNEIILSRIIDAPREKVWEAFTKAEHLKQWWGPNGFSITTKEFDFREGGIWRFTMHGPDGKDYPNDIVFTKLQKPELMEHDHGADDGTVHFQARIKLEDLGGKTNLIMRTVLPTKEILELLVRENGVIEGGKQTLRRLADYIVSMS